MEKTINEEKQGLSTANLVLKLLIPILGLAGIGISGYLTYIHFRNLASICLFNASCDTVLTSPYAQIWSIPLALCGLLMYIVITVLGFMSLGNKKEWGSLLAMGIYGFSLASVLFTLYLYYLEIFEIHAFCTWCIGSSIVVLFLFVLSLVNLSKEGLNFKELPHYARITMKRYVRW